MNSYSPSRLVLQSLRTHVCVGCEIRPSGSEAWGAKVQRPCEDKCTIFANLQSIEQIVGTAGPDDREALHDQFQETICLNCHVCQSKGDLGERHHSCTCPLRLNEEKVVNVIDGILQAASDKDL